LSAGLPPPPFLYPIVDVAALGGRSVGEAVSALAAAGVRLLQLRAKDVTDRALLALAREAVAAAHAGGARLLVNDRADVARIVGADGVHVGQEDLSPADARAVLGSEAVIGVSTHDLDQLRRAMAEPVDYVALGPIFATASKAHPDPVVGLETLRAARGIATRPLVAIGGITRARSADVARAGAEGVAVISDLLKADDLAAAVAEFEAALAQGKIAR
jgi:thiamine-phosphate pyrophosphorylase